VCWGKDVECWSINCTFDANVRTANGLTQKILGRITVPLTFKNTTVDMDLFICLTLEQELYLGVDFWQSFGVAPRIFALKEVLTAPKVKKPPENNCRITTAIGDGAKSLSVV